MQNKKDLRASPVSPLFISGPSRDRTPDLLNAINAHPLPFMSCLWYLVVFVLKMGRFWVQNFQLMVPVADCLRYIYHTVLPSPFTSFLSF